MAQKLNPFSGRQFLDANGDPYNGAQLFVYEAGTSTKYTLTKDSAGASNHANPIILNSRGEPGDGAGASQAMWQAEGQNVKLVLAPSTDTDPPVSAISSWDNLEPMNDTTIVTSDEWLSGATPTFISSTSFSVATDLSSTYHVGRRIKTTNTGGTIYSTITAVAFSTVTTVTVENDSGSLDSGLSAVWYSLLSSDNGSTPGTVNHRTAFVKGTDIASAAALTIPNDGNYFDVTGTTAITSIGTIGGGGPIKLQFDGALTLTYHATDLILPSDTNITTAAGDIAEFFEYASGDWILTNYVKASGLNTVVQIKTTEYATYSTTTTVMAADNTIPQNTEGAEIMTLAITPKNTANRLKIEASFLGSGSSGSITPVVALFQDSTADALAVSMMSGDTPLSTEGGSIPLDHNMAAGTTSSTTFKIRVGPSATGTAHINGHNAGGTPAGLFSTAGKCTLTITEYVP